jgi:CII-binding regulator of phage lambda lysogenization HflD
MLIELQLETAKIQAQMQQLNGKFDDFGKTVTKQGAFLEKFKATAAGVFAGNAMLVGLNMVKGALVGAVRDAQEYEKAIAQLNAGLKSTGNVAGLSVEGLKEQASALERLSTIDENLIMQSQAVFQTFTNVRNVVGEGNDIFNQASLAAVNLSTKMKGDLQGATVQLGKALNDPIKGITALTRVGVVFTAQQKEQIKALMDAGDVMGAQKIILAEMETEFGGAAAAAGDTFAGAVIRAKDKVQDFTRDLVSNLQPILLAIGKTIGDLYNKFLAPLFDIINKNKEALAAFAGVILTAVVAFKTYNVILAISKALQTGYAVAQVLMTGGQLASIASTNGLAASMLRLNAIMRANPIGLIVTGIALLAAGFVVAWNHSETFRKIVIQGLQIVLNGVGYLVGGFSKMIGLFAKIPGMGWAKGIADGASKAANEIRAVSDGLTSLSNKKITIPGFGGGADTTGKDGGADAPTAVTAAKLKSAEKAAKDRLNSIEKQNKEVVKIYDKMDKVISDSNDKRIKIQADYDKKVLDLKNASLKKVAALENKAFADRNDAEQKASNDRLSIIKKGQEMLRSAFAAGAAFDLADMFKDTDKTGANLLSMMKGKLVTLNRLKNDAYRLAAAGFSQTFIQDVVKNGPEVGSEMAAAILNSSPDVQAQLKELYYGLEDVSKYGLNTLAKQMNTSTKFATQELMFEYNTVGLELEKTFEKINSELRVALEEEATTLKDALLEAQKDFNGAIDQLQKDTMDKLRELQNELAKTAKQIAAVQGTSAAISVLANAPAAPIIAGVTPLGISSNATNQPAGNLFTVNQVNNINGQTSVADITTATVTAIKFGTTARSINSPAVQGMIRGANLQ